MEAATVTYFHKLQRNGGEKGGCLHANENATQVITLRRQTEACRVTIQSTHRNSGIHGTKF